VAETPFEHRRGSSVVLGGPEHQDDIGVVDAARVVRMGRSPDGDAGRNKGDHEQDGERGNPEEHGVTAKGRHRTMLTTTPARIVLRQVMRIHTPSDENPTAAEDRNVPRILATAPNLYGPGGAIANER
jgi:hypothetical protein